MYSHEITSTGRQGLLAESERDEWVQAGANLPERQAREAFVKTVCYGLVIGLATARVNVVLVPRLYRN